MVRELTSKILEQAERVRTIMADQGAVAAQEALMKKQELLEQRQNIFDALLSAVAHDDNMAYYEQKYQQLPRLKQLSKEIRQLRGPTLQSSPAMQQIEAMISAIGSNLLMLQEIVGEDRELPWRLRYCTDVDPLSQHEPISLGGGVDSVILDNSQGKLVWADHCGTCHYELGGSDRRWTCLACVVDGIQCDACHRAFGEVHRDCRHPAPPVAEDRHRVLARMETLIENSLSRTLIKIFETWSERPCFHAAGQGDDHDGWLTYHQVLHRALQISSLLLDEGATELLLCFPAGSMDFYFFDLGAALAGVPTVGITVSPLPPSDVLPTTSHAASHESVRGKLLENKLLRRSSCKLINLQDAEKYNPAHQIPFQGRDDPDGVYTTYYTSGSTGKPKAIPTTRKEFMGDFAHVVMKGDFNCTLSFQPPCWASDRGLVYATLFNGGRIGFSRPTPSLPEIVQDVAEIEPTLLSVPPVLLQFLNALDPPAFLGSRLQEIHTGGAPVGPNTKRAIADTYGVIVRESYGTTECSGIASDGRILPDKLDMIRLKDPSTGEWLAVTEEGVVGELWVGRHNTQDLVELTDNGKQIQVLGRSGSASSFKAINGKWCSLIEIEDEIVRSCSPDLLLEAFVFVNTPGSLLLVARTPDDLEDGADLLANIRDRAVLSPEMLPSSIILTKDPFPKTATMKIKREALATIFREQRNGAQSLGHPNDNTVDRCSDAVQIASRVLGHGVNPEASFLENGGDSLTAVRWLHEMKVLKSGISSSVSWRSILSSPLSRIGQSVGEVHEEHLVFEPPPAPSATAKHVLLTGATGFLGQQVLKELLVREDSTTIVCLVRETSVAKLTPSSRVMVVTEVPLEYEYKAVYHLAAEVNHVLDYNSLKASNVDLTADLLRLRLAPMVYSSTVSTRQGTPPFADGYTQAKWVSEQMVANSGGTCVWVPFLLWGNERDWFTRLVKHCVKTGVFPAELGFLISAPVELTAKELVAGGPCTAFELDLAYFFSLLRREVKLRSVPLSAFVASIRRDPTSAAFPILPLVAECKKIGNGSVPGMEPFPLKQVDVRRLLRLLDM